VAFADIDIRSSGEGLGIGFVCWDVWVVVLLVISRDLQEGGFKLGDVLSRTQKLLNWELRMG